MEVENVSLKLEKDFLREIEKVMKKNRYMTKAEFIREAIREKIKELEKQRMLRAVERVFGSSKHRTTEEELHKAGERAFDKLEKKFKATTH